MKFPHYLLTRYLPTALLLSSCALPVSQWDKKLEVGPLPPEAQEYYLLVNRLRKKNFAVDFQLLRIGWTYTPEYLGGGQIEKTALADAWRHSQQGRHKRCLARAGEALVYNYTSLAAHNWAAFCAAQMGLQQDAAYHREVLNRLLTAILTQGNGETPENAWRLTSASELASLAQLLGLEIRDITPAEQSEALLQVRVTDLVEQEDRTFWADYSIPMERYRRARRQLALPDKAEADEAAPSPPQPAAEGEAPP